MKIYIDFDDVLCETAKYFTVLVKELFAINVPYEQVHSFNLQKSFNLNDVQYDELMKAGHLPQNLLAYEETFDASKVSLDLSYNGSYVTSKTVKATYTTPDKETLDAVNKIITEHH